MTEIPTLFKARVRIRVQLLKERCHLSVDELCKVAFFVANSVLVDFPEHVICLMSHTLYFDIKKDGKHIGEIEIAQVDLNTINATWLGIRDKERGNGHATAVLMTTISECKKRGYKTMTLEVPGDSPDARHIYEKLGFKAGEQISEDDVWGGLTSMSLDLDKYEF